MWLNLSQLPPEKKQFAWQWLQENKPDLAALLSLGDVRNAQKTFSSDISIPLEPHELADLREKLAFVKQESV